MKGSLKIGIIFLMLISCEEAEYSLDNPFDPENIDLRPPALFFHPPEILAELDTSISIELYGLELEPAAAAQQGVLDIYIYYLPDAESDQNEGGTWSLATVYFSTISTGESELLYGSNTILRDANNDSVRIKDFGKGYISVE